MINQQASLVCQKKNVATSCACFSLAEKKKHKDENEAQLHDTKLLKGRSKALKNLKENLKLTLLQKQVLVGILLGDAHLSTQDKGKTYRLHIYQSEKHEAYVFHLYDIFKEWVLTKPTKIKRTYKTGLLKGKQGFIISFKTISSSAFRFYAHSFYPPMQQTSCLLVNKHWSLENSDFEETKLKKETSKLSKKVPRIINRCLTARGLAYWFMTNRRSNKLRLFLLLDDGSLKSKQTKAVYLNTQGFLLKDVENLCLVLKNKFGLKVRPVEKKKLKSVTQQSKLNSVEKSFENDQLAINDKQTKQQAALVSQQAALVSQQAALVSPVDSSLSTRLSCLSYYQIYIHAESYQTFKNLIEPYLLPEMLYKFPK